MSKRPHSKGERYYTNKSHDERMKKTLHENYKTYYYCWGYTLKYADRELQERRHIREMDLNEYRELTRHTGRYADVPQYVKPPRKSDHRVWAKRAANRATRRKKFDENTSLREKGSYRKDYDLIWELY